MRETSGPVLNQRVGKKRKKRKRGGENKLFFAPPRMNHKGGQKNGWKNFMPRKKGGGGRFFLGRGATGSSGAFFKGEGARRGGDKGEEAPKVVKPYFPLKGESTGSLTVFFWIDGFVKGVPKRKGPRGGPWGDLKKAFIHSKAGGVSQK